MIDTFKGVDKRSNASTEMLNKTKKIRDLVGGTETMRAAGKQYLPKNPKEKQKSYDSRLALSWLFNGTNQTIKDMTGYVFDVAVKLGPDTAEMVESWTSNIDMQNNNLNNFARNVFEDGMAAGISYIMVDAPRRDEELTAADEEDGGFRPFMSMIKNEDVLGIRTGIIDNKTVLTQIRISENVEEDDGLFGVSAINQIRVINREGSDITVTVYRSSKGKWIVHEEEYTIDGMSEIPVAPFYTGRTAFFKAVSILDDLANVNIAHWQSQSDQRNILHVARVPILFGSGIPDDVDIIVSADRAMTTPTTESTLAWVELQGQSIPEGREDLKALEFQMETHGLQLLVQKASAQSATGEALDAKKETSQLSMIASNLEDTLETAYGWMEMFAGVNVPTDVVVNKEFGTIAITAHELSTLLAAVNSGKISHATFLDELKRRGTLSDKIDIEAEIDLIGEESSGLDVGAADLEDEEGEGSGGTVVDFLGGVEAALNGG